MTLLTDMKNAETALVARIEREIAQIGSGAYDAGALAKMMADLAALRALIAAKRI